MSRSKDAVDAMEIPSRRMVFIHLIPAFCESAAGSRPWRCGLLGERHGWPVSRTAYACTASELPAEHPVRIDLQARACA